MSQKVRVERVEVEGATPFLGMTSPDDGAAPEPIYSRDPDRVMRWLADGWRSRFNDYRSRRKKTAKGGVLIPLGHTVDDRKMSEARSECSWLESIPAHIIQSPERLESNDWWAAVARRRTLIEKKQKPGKMPGFRKKSQDATFACWYHGGLGFEFVKYNRKHGAIIIGGQNQKDRRLPGEKQRFKIIIRVRLSEDIRPHTSVKVNWTERSLVFVNDPRPLRDAEASPTGRAVGLDRGIVHNLADTDGRFYDLPKAKLKKIDAEIRRRQRAQARAVKASGHKDQRKYREAGVSRRFAEHDRRISELHARSARIVRDFQEKWTTELVMANDLIATEKLQVAKMGSKPKPVPDPKRPGKYLPNGRAAKRGLNRSLRGAALGQIQALLRDKCARANVVLIEVDPRNTSRRCNECGHIAKENRKSQAVFLCESCGNSCNADLNAAKNILERGLRDASKAQGGTRPASEPPSDLGEGTARAGAGAMKREPLLS